MAGVEVVKSTFNILIHMAGMGLKLTGGVLLRGNDLPFLPLAIQLELHRVISIYLSAHSDYKEARNAICCHNLLFSHQSNFDKHSTNISIQSLRRTATKTTYVSYPYLLQLVLMALGRPKSPFIMQIINLPAVAMAVIGMTAGVSAGINCRGAGGCLGQAGSLSTLIAFVSERIDPNRWYKNGEHIVCAGAGGTGLCAFPQNTGGIPGKAVLKLLQDLHQHGCSKCGSIPIFFPDGDNNDNTHGILTVNQVARANCQGVC